MIYAIIINVLGFAIMYADKKFAQEQRRRIPESLLFLVAIFGGGVGILAAMFLCRHKTHKKLFTIGVPIVLLIQIYSVVRYYLTAVA